MAILLKNSQLGNEILDVLYFHDKGQHGNFDQPSIPESVEIVGVIWRDTDVTDLIRSAGLMEEVEHAAFG